MSKAVSDLEVARHAWQSGHTGQAILSLIQHLERQEAVRPIVEQPRNIGGIVYPEPQPEPTVLYAWKGVRKFFLYSDGKVRDENGIAAEGLQANIDALRAAGLLRLPGDTDPAKGLVEALESVRMDTHHESHAWKVATDALAIYREMTEGK